MANVDQKVEQIRQAIYGKDVRESIASGIEAINAETESTTTRQTKLEGDMATAKQEVIQATADAIAATNYANAAGNSASNAATSATSASESANNAAEIANNFVTASEVCESYNNIKTYIKYNKVTYLGSTYQCLADGTQGITPDTGNTKWLLIAAKGSDGVGGDMFKNIYDTNDNGIVDKSETITDGTNVYTATNIKNQFDSFESGLSDMTNRINSLNTNDVQARQEIIDIKLKLKEQQSIDFINKTGIGYYDLFKDKTGIYEPNTTATIDTPNHKIVFPTANKYTVKSVGAFTDVAEIKVDKEVNVKDRVNNVEVLNKIAVEEIGTQEVINSAVVSQTYSISGNGGRKLVRLSNGWLVSVFYYVTNKRYIFMKSIDNGITWSELCYIEESNLTGDITSIASNNTTVLVLFGRKAVNAINFVKFDAITANGNIGLGNVLDTTSTAIDTCSLTINPQGTELHACWTCKNSTYPNSLNVKYRKGTIDVNNNVVWDDAEQVTKWNDSNLSEAFKTPCIILDKDNIPTIIMFSRISFSISDPQGTSITISIIKRDRTLYYTGNSISNLWSAKNIITSGTEQALPCAIFVPQSINGLSNGRIWVSWQGTVNTSNGRKEIYYSYSDDNGLTWISAIKATDSTTDSSFFPSLTANKNNDVFIVLAKNTNMTTPLSVHMYNITKNTTQQITELNNPANASALFDEKFNIDFSIPLTICQSGTAVLFNGTWQDTITNYNLSLASNIATTDKQELTVQPYKFKNLKMLPQTFDKFDNINLALYPTKINKAIIKEAVNNSTTVITGVTDKEITVGDKLFMNGVLNEVVNSTSYINTNDIQDTMITNNAYDTSGNGGRKLVRLSNGWLVCVIGDSTKHIFYVSKDSGNTWSELCNLVGGRTRYNGYISIVAKENIIYGIAKAGTQFIDYFKFDASTVINSDIGSLGLIESIAQSDIGQLSLAINQTGTELHACWSSKNSTYSSSFNIRYAKGAIESDGSVTWGNVEQVTIRNATGNDIKNPSIIIDKNNNAHILTEFYGFNYIVDYSNSITTKEEGNSNWNNKIVYKGSGYTQSSSSAIFVPTEINGLPNGRIWVAWQGSDSIDTNYYNLRVSYSDDGGVTWFAMKKLTNGNTYHDGTSPSITYNIQNEIFIVFHGVDTNFSTSKYNIKEICCSNDTWSSITTITSNTTASAQLASTLVDNSCDFSTPLFIYQDNQNSKVGFYGTWTTGEGYTLTMKNPTTLSANVQVPIVDLEAKQATADMTLKDIDEEKFIYDSSNLNTTTSDITVLGSATELDTMSYAIS